MLADLAEVKNDGGWLQHPVRFSLEPALTLGPGPFDTGDGVALSLAQRAGIEVPAARIETADGKQGPSGWRLSPA